MAVPEVGGFAAGCGTMLMWLSILRSKELLGQASQRQRKDAHSRLVDRSPMASKYSA